MARCNSCRTLIVFGGVRDGRFRYCSESCADSGRIERMTQVVPRELLERYIRAVHQGDCPQCGGPGPLDVYESPLWSEVTRALHSRRRPICCRRCGIKVRLRAALSSALLGIWWSPWELILTPVMFLRNGVTFLRRDAAQPSSRLERWVKLELAASATKLSDGCAAEASK